MEVKKICCQFEWWHTDLLPPEYKCWESLALMTGSFPKRQCGLTVSRKPNFTNGTVEVGADLDNPFKRLCSDATDNVCRTSAG